MTTFLPVPEWVLGRSGVTWGAKVCLGLLYKHERSRKKAWPCVTEITEGMRNPRRSVERWLSELVGAGLVTSERVGREVRYAPSVAVDGTPRDLSPCPPRTADVEPEEHPPQAADVRVIHPPQVADVEKSHLSLGIREIEEERHEPRVRGALVSGYAERYQAAYSRAWMSASKAGADIDLVARWCGSEPDPMAAAAAVLDGAFADPWLTERRVPWGPIAKDPARFADAGKGTAAERAKKHLESVKRRLAQEKLHGTEERVRELQAEYDRIIWGPVRADPVPDRSRGGALDGAQGGRVPEELRRLGGAVG